MTRPASESYSWLLVHWWWSSSVQPKQQRLTMQPKQFKSVQWSQNNSGWRCSQNNADQFSAAKTTSADFAAKTTAADYALKQHRLTMQPKQQRLTMQPKQFRPVQCSQNNIGWLCSQNNSDKPTLHTRVEQIRIRHNQISRSWIRIPTPITSDMSRIAHVNCVEVAKSNGLIGSPKVNINTYRLSNNEDYLFCNFHADDTNH